MKCLTEKAKEKKSATYTHTWLGLWPVIFTLATLWKALLSLLWQKGGFADVVTHLQPGTHGRKHSVTSAGMWEIA